MKKKSEKGMSEKGGGNRQYFLWFYFSNGSCRFSDVGGQLLLLLGSDYRYPLETSVYHLMVKSPRIYQLFLRILKKKERSYQVRVIRSSRIRWRFNLSVVSRRLNFRSFVNVRLFYRRYPTSRKLWVLGDREISDKRLLEETETPRGQT